MSAQPIDQPETEHAALLLEPSATARQIAHSALAVAHSDIVAAIKQMTVLNNIEEAIQIIAEAREQLEFAQRAVSGSLWTVRL